MAIAEDSADIELLVTVAEMRNDVKQKLMKGEQLPVFGVETNQCVVNLAHLCFPPAQRIRVRDYPVGMLQKVLKTFDGLFQIVVVARVDDGFAFDGIALGKLFPQLVDGVIPDDVRHIQRFVRLRPPRVVDKEEAA